jgi:hypothetical protein
MSTIQFMSESRFESVRRHLTLSQEGRQLQAAFNKAFVGAESDKLVTRDLQEVIASFALMLPSSLNGDALTMVDLDRAIGAACCLLLRASVVKRAFDAAPTDLVDDPLLSRIVSRGDWKALPSQAQADDLNVNLDVLRCFLFQQTVASNKTTLLRTLQRYG